MTGMPIIMTVQIYANRIRSSVSVSIRILRQMRAAMWMVFYSRATRQTNFPAAVPMPTTPLPSPRVVDVQTKVGPRNNYTAYSSLPTLLVPIPTPGNSGSPDLRRKMLSGSYARCSTSSSSRPWKRRWRTRSKKRRFRRHLQQLIRLPKLMLKTRRTIILTEKALRKQMVLIVIIIIVTERWRRCHEEEIDGATQRRGYERGF